MLRDEIAQLVDRRGGRLHEWWARARRRRWTPAALRRLVPDIARRDVYVCGPGGFMHGLDRPPARWACRRQRIHHEDFAF